MKPKIFLLTLLLSILTGTAFSQADKLQVIKGVVLDAQTNLPISAASITVVDQNHITRTNQFGKFTIVLNVSDVKSTTKIKVTCVGYKSEIVPLMVNNETEIHLSPQTEALKEVTVKKQKYRNKKNPAVELIEKVIANKSKNRSEALNYYENEKYEKIEFALDDITPKFRQRKIFKHFQFMFIPTDSTGEKGTEIMPIYLTESISKHYYRKSPRNEKDIVLSSKRVNFEGLDNKGLEDNIKYLYQDINIYDNNINLLTNQFLSPIAPTAPNFYRYYILDTIQSGSDKYIKLFFGSRNKEDMLFEGFLYITLDGTYAIRGVELTVNKNINLNFVKNVKIIQQFDKTEHEGWLLSSDETSVDFGLTKKGQGLLGRRTVSYSKYRFDPSTNESIFKGKSVEVLDSATLRSKDYWSSHRPDSLSKTEEQTYAILDSVQKVPVFKAVYNVASVILFGYEDLGKFEIGPVNTFYMYNPIEGFRLRLGGRTTDKLSKRFNLEEYAAYGFTDQRFKYYLGGSYSFTNRGLLDFPLKSLKMSYQNETQLPGQQMKFLMEDNFLLSIKRGVNNKLFYNKTFTIENLNEFENHFSYTLGYKFINQAPGGTLRFNYTDYLAQHNDVSSLNISEFYLNLRYAPHESFYQGKTYRIPIYSPYPIFEFRFNAGSTAWGNSYNYQIARFLIHKRFYFSVLGYTDVAWEAGKIFGKVPYPILNIPQANQTYSYQIESYNMMNFLEFVTDQYTSLLIDHSFNGFFFNKIPFMNKLGWREVVTCKILYGNVTKTNDPRYNNDLFRLPVEPDGTPITYTLGKTPYIEGSVGISNILKVFRVDLVKRFTYLNNPNVSEYGIRVRFRFDI